MDKADDKALRSRIGLLLKISSPNFYLFFFLSLSHVYTVCARANLSVMCAVAEEN